MLNFAPAQFTTESLDESATWTRAVKDGPVVALVIVLLLDPRVRARLRMLMDQLSLSTVSRALRSDATPQALLSGLLLAAAALGAFMALSSAVLQAPALGTLVSARYYVLYPVVAVLLACLRPPRLRPFGVALLVLGCLQTVLAVLDFFGVLGVTFYFGQIQFAGYSYPRAIGTLGNPNNLGLFLGLVVIVVVSTVGIRRWSGRLALLVLTVGIVLTLSRTALIALGVTLVVAVVASQHRRHRWTLAVGLALLFGVLLVLAAGSRNGSGASLSGIWGNRGDTAQNALQQWTSGPQSFLVGHGFASVSSVTDGGSLSNVVVDNMPLSIALEGGLVGLLLVAWMVVMAVRLALLAPRDSPLGVVSRRYAILFLVYAPLSINLRLFPGSLFFWMLMGLSGGVAWRTTVRR